MKRRIAVIIAIVAFAAVGIYYWMTRRPQSIVLTGIVTTDDVRVSSQIQGRLQKHMARQGDTVQKDQLLAVIQPQELQADRGYY